MSRILAFVLVCGFAFSAQAISLKEKKKVQDWNDYLKDPAQSYVKSVKDKCGFDIPLTMEGEKMVGPFMEANAHAASYCDTPRGTIATMCDDATAKTEIKAKIKKVTCKLGKGDEVTLKLAGGDLQLTVGTGAGNLDEKVKKFLDDNL